MRDDMEHSAGYRHCSVPAVVVVEAASICSIVCLEEEAAAAAAAAVVVVGSGQGRTGGRSHMESAYRSSCTCTGANPYKQGSVQRKGVGGGGTETMCALTTMKFLWTLLKAGIVDAVPFRTVV